MPRDGHITDGDARPLIVLEFNELCPPLLRRWMDDGSLPHFAQLHAQSDVFTTRADAPEGDNLEPWIQWYSAHTGLPFSTHGVFHLTEGADAGHDDVFAMLRRAGKSVFSFSSMNNAPFAQEGSIFLADPWSEDGNAFPPELNIYNRFVAQNVREYSNAGHRMGTGDYARFVSFMLRRGFGISSIAAIARQLIAERLPGPDRTWKRVKLLDRLQFDLFAHYWRAQKPDFATFFSNSVAHLQHSYWRHMAPESFEVRPGAQEQAAYGDAVRQGYIAHDAMLGRFMAMAQKAGARLMLATALSQQPFLRHEGSGGQNFYRPHDIAALLAMLSVDYREVSPTMTHQFYLQCADEAGARAARERLAALQMADGRGVFGFPNIETRADALYFGCQISARVDDDAQVIDRVSGEARDFASMFYRIPALKSGRHHPDGALWIQRADCRGTVHEARVSILDILPTQLGLAGVAPPGNADLPGRDLLARQTRTAGDQQRAA